VTTQVIRTDKPDPPRMKRRSRCAHHVEGHRRAQGRAQRRQRGHRDRTGDDPGLLQRGFEPLGGSPFGVFRPALVPAELVPQYVVVLGGERTVVDSIAARADVTVVADPGPSALAPVAPPSA